MVSGTAVKNRGELSALPHGIERSLLIEKTHRSEGTNPLFFRLFFRLVAPQTKAFPSPKSISRVLLVGLVRGLQSLLPKNVQLDSGTFAFCHTWLLLVSVASAPGAGEAVCVGSQ